MFSLFSDILHTRTQRKNILNAIYFHLFTLQMLSKIYARDTR